MSDQPPPVKLTDRTSVDRYVPLTPVRDDVAIRRETMRSWIALILVLTVVLGAVGIFALVWVGRLPGEVLLQGVFPSLVGLAGTAIGYYFGSQSRSDG